VSMAVANRYAQALADVLAGKGDYRVVFKELEAFAAAYRTSAELREVFETPAVPMDGKLKVLTAILARLGSSVTTSNFLHVLVTNYRLTVLEEILRVVSRIVSDRVGVVEIQISSASELSEETRRDLRARFQQVTQKQVEMEFHLQEELVGGILAQIRSTVYDGSVRGQLDRIREKLIAR
jgi:F-type H+-transporting ATPase subunit delta